MSEPLTILFDPQMPYRERQQQGWLNMGCPPGYFAQLVGITEENARAVPGITDHLPSSGIRCRLMPQDMSAASVQEIIDESGVTAQEALEVLEGAMRDTVPQIGFNLGVGLAVALFIGYMAILRPR